MTTDAARPFRVPRGFLGAIVTIGVAQATALVAMLLILRGVIDAMVTAPGDLRRTTTLIAGMAATTLAYAGLRWLEFSLAEAMGYQLVRRLRMQMYRHLSGMAPRQLQHRSRGALLLRFTGDLTMFRTWVSRGLARGIVAAFALVAGTALLVYLSIWMALVLAAVLLVAAAASLSVGGRLRRLTRSVRRKRSTLTSNVDEQLAALATVQAFGRTRGETSRLSRQNDSMTRSLVREARVRGLLRGIAVASTWLALAAVLAVGAVEVAAGHLTLGGVVAAMVAVRQMSVSVRTAALSHDYWQRAQVSKRKIRDFLASSSRPLDAPEQRRLRVRRGRIEFSQVTVTGALRGFDAVVEPGQIVAVTGPTGAGKTTLLGAVARLTELDAGTIAIDGQDVAHCTLGSMHRYIGVVGPDLPLMRGTIRRNLTYRKPTASEGEVERQLKAWRLDELLARRSGGLDSWVTEGARNLSAGERQRLCLARAWVGNPPILLLDEPATALDEEGRKVFHRVLVRHAGTVLLVTHDPAEVALADVVWHLDDGRLVAVETGEQYARRSARDTRLGRPA